MEEDGDGDEGELSRWRFELLFRVDFSWLRSGERVVSVVVVIRRGLFVDVDGWVDGVDDVTRQLK